MTDFIVYFILVIIVITCSLMLLENWNELSAKPVTKRFHNDIPYFKAIGYRPEIFRREIWLRNKFEELLELSEIMENVEFKIDQGSEDRNAFCCRNIPYDGYKVVLEFGLLRVLTNNELLSVISHELGHIAHGDCDSGEEVGMWQEWKQEFLADAYAVRLMRKYFASRKNWRSVRHITYQVHVKTGAYFSLMETLKEKSDHPDGGIRKLFIWAYETFS